MSRLCRSLVCVIVALCAVLTTRAADAAGARQVVVGDFDGERAEAFRDAVLITLAGHSEIRLVSLSHARKLAQRIEADLGEASGVKKVASALGLAAFVDGSIKSGTKWTATIHVRAGSDGEVSESISFTAKSDKALLAKIRKTGWSQLSPALLEAEPAKVGGAGYDVVIGPFSGPKAGIVRDAVVKALKKAKNIRVVPETKLDESGIKLGKKSTDADYAGAAAATGAAAVLVGTVSAKGNALSLEIAVRNGSDGKSVGSSSLEPGPLATLKQAIDRDLAQQLEQPLGKTAGAAPPAEQLPEGAGAAQEEVEEENGEQKQKPEPGAGARPSPLEVIGGIRGFSRNFRYTDDLFNALRSYKLSVAPAAFVLARWYPLAHMQGGPLAQLGLTGGYEQGFLLASKAPDGSELSTSARQWWLGLRYRIPRDRHEIGVDLTYGKQSFVIDDDPRDPFVPDVGYSWIRLGVDGRLRIKRVVLGAQLGYRYLTGTGELGDDTWFPHASGGGIDLGLLGGYEIMDGLDLLAGLDFRRYYFSMNSEPADVHVAGGALDDYIAGWGGLAYRLPGNAKP